MIKGTWNLTEQEHFLISFFYKSIFPFELYLIQPNPSDNPKTPLAGLSKSKLDWAYLTMPT